MSALLALLAAPVAGEPRTQKGETAFVALMHEELSTLNSISEALLRDEFEAVELHAARLAAHNERLRNWDLASCGLDPERNEEFDRIVGEQAEATGSLTSAAKRRDASGVLLATQQIISAGCVSCHSAFLDSDQGRTPRVLLMRTLLESVRSLTAAVVLNDFALVAREARAIGAAAKIFDWPQVIEQLFAVSGADRTEAFRSHLDALRSEAIRVESAAVAGKPRAVAEATRRMLEHGCVACHAQFRN